ncbi:hypothetical protein PRIPAC_86595 [Pristionchus pacificus]|uniref:Uncharacterized protein n=1 Tax=Pristionchus pacificus TaxID=54126 RepID=A0A2A6BMU3_PRIPA|nr:hypothetical protein PRIPAC_86595 [Pristionchus pacificus]|eukprot:PDM67116.1 hypothetical protein PRIPAC_48533 [Pristionchus pacificus]
MSGLAEEVSEIVLGAVGHVDTEGTAVEIGSIELRDGILSGLFVSELAESESLRTASLAVDHQTAKKNL